MSFPRAQKRTVTEPRIKSRSSRMSSAWDRRPPTIYYYLLHQGITLSVLAIMHALKPSPKYYFQNIMYIAVCSYSPVCTSNVHSLGKESYFVSWKTLRSDPPLQTDSHTSEYLKEKLLSHLHVHCSLWHLTNPSHFNVWNHSGHSRWWRIIRSLPWN